MKRRYPLLFLLVPIGLFAQPTLPPFYPYIEVPCPYDAGQILQTYAGWEAYQTLDDHWDGPRDSTRCIDLAYLQGQVEYPSIDLDQTDRTRPVFLRLLLDSANAIALSTNDQYAINMTAYINTSGLDLTANCPDGLCTGVRAAVRVPDATGAGTLLRWYTSEYVPDQGGEFSLCLPTEKFPSNALRELVYSFKPVGTATGQWIYFSTPWMIDMDLDGTLLRLTEDVLPLYNTGPSSYAFDGFFFQNFLVMHPDTTYPDADHIGYLDFSPLPNQAQATPVVLTLAEYTGFNFQPYTQLRGGLLLGEDSLRHPLTVINEGADLCLSWQIVELIWGEGSHYVHQGGHISFGGERSCLLFKPGSTLEIPAGSAMHYGTEARGMLALLSGSSLVIGNGGELVMHGMLVIKEAPGATVPEDMHLTLHEGARLVFAPGSRIHNANSLNGSMRLVVTLDGGSIDISGLSPEDRVKVVLVELPLEDWTELQVLGNPIGESLDLAFAVRATNTMVLRVIDPLGKLVTEQRVAVNAGANRVSVPLPGLPTGGYVLEARQGDQRQVLHFVKE